MSSSYLPVKNSTASFWHSEPSEIHNHRSTPELPKEVDVLIVGAGYAGTTTAYYLMKDNAKKPSVLMLEARFICSGATGRNGGHLKPDVYRSYEVHAAELGPREAAAIINFESDHVPAMAELIEKEQIDCDFHMTRACDVDLVPQQVQKSLNGLAAMKKNPYVRNKDAIQLLSGKDAKNVSKCEEATHCITYPAGSLWPYKLISGLLQKLLALGLNLQTNTPVLGTEKLANGKFLVKTDRGDVICSKLVLATNAYTKSVAPEFDGKITPIKGACSHIALQDPNALAPNLVSSYGLRFEGSQIDYMINRTDGSIILGGAKQHIFPYPETFFDVVDDSFIIKNTDKYFENYMQTHFYTWKDTQTVMDYCWSGILGYSDDTLPYVGESTTEKGKYVIAGFHGHGMPRVLLCAKAIAECIKDESSIAEKDIPESFKLTEKRMKRKDLSMLKDTVKSSGNAKL